MVNRTGRVGGFAASILAALISSGCGPASTEGSDDTGTVASVREDACKKVTLTVAPTGHVDIGQNITLTAAGGCDTTDTPTYRFTYVQEGTPGTTEIAPFGAAATVTLPTSGSTGVLSSGKYSFNAQIRAAGTTGAAVTSNTDTLLIGDVCTAVKLTAGPASPQPVGTPTVKLTATGTCTSGSASEYQFLVKRPGQSTYASLRGFGADTYDWNTGTEPVGEYSVLVRARVVGNTSIAEAQQAIPYRLGETCSIQTTTASPPGPSQFGTAVTLGATSTCTGGTSAEYRFSVLPNGSTKYSVLRDWNATASAQWDTSSNAPWNTTGGTPNVNTVLVEVRANDFAGSATSSKKSTYMLGQVCNSVALSTSPADSAQSGTTVTLTGTATCPLGGTAEYQFSVRPSSSSTFTSIRDWSATPTATWSSTSPAPYQMRVDARQGNSGPAESTATASVSVTGILFERQFGASGNDLGEGVAADTAGNSYAFGNITGSVSGTTFAGGQVDGILVKYQQGTGTRLWIQDIGTSGLEQAGAVAVSSSGVFSVGTTNGTFAKNTNAGGDDAFLAKYTTDGAPVWTVEFGSAGLDEGEGVAADSSGNSYVVGDTTDGLDGTVDASRQQVFVRKYSANAAVQWTTTVAPGIARSMAGPDSSGNIYVSGATSVDLSGGTRTDLHVFVSKLSEDGELAWTEESTPSDKFQEPWKMAVTPAGNVYVVVETPGNGGAMFSYSTAGKRRWSQAFPNENAASASAVTVDGAGNVYVGLSTPGSATVVSHSMVVKYSSAGTQLGTLVTGSGGGDFIAALAADPSKNIFSTGGIVENGSDDISVYGFRL